MNWAAFLLRLNGNVAMAVDPDSLDDTALVRRLLDNAVRFKDNDLVMRCQVRIAKLESLKYLNPIEREFWEAVEIAEELASQRNGRATRLSRTRQKEKRVGFKQCLIDWALQSGVTDRFKLLVEGGHPELTGEAIVIRHSESLLPNVVMAAAVKLADHGVDPDTFKHPQQS